MEKLTRAHAKIFARAANTNALTYPAVVSDDSGPDGAKMPRLSVAQRCHIASRQNSLKLSRGQRSTLEGLQTQNMAGTSWGDPRRHGDCCLKRGGCCQAED